MTMIRELLIKGAKRLKQLPVSELEAELLLCYTLKCSRVNLRTWPEKEVSELDITKFNACISRRLIGEPFAYLVGKKDFWTFSVEVSEAVLIPRPETELLVEKALDRANVNESIELLELGTGSGAIAIALALERPNANIIVTDCSKEAIFVAKKNVQFNKVNNITFVLGSWFSPFKKTCSNFSCILSNPPYIDENDPCLQNDGVCYEPTQGLISNNQGLSDLIYIITYALYYLLPGGWLLLEHGFEQGTLVRQIFKNNQYQCIETYKDLGDCDRVTVGKKYS